MGWYRGDHIFLVEIWCIQSWEKKGVRSCSQDGCEQVPFWDFIYCIGAPVCPSRGWSAAGRVGWEVDLKPKSPRVRSMDAVNIAMEEERWERMPDVRPDCALGGAEVLGEECFG